MTEGEPITWDPFHDLAESRAVGGVLVLPSEAFAAGTGHSDSGNHGGRAALVMHHFHASSWPTQHPRYKHPVSLMPLVLQKCHFSNSRQVYGEVEKCNWDPECVALWDTNTAFFESLPEEDQLKMIALKDQDDAQKLKADAEVDPRLALHGGKNR